MATITPTLTITANSSSATTPGPISTAINISATTSLTTDCILAAATMVPPNTGAPTKLFDGDALSFAGIGSGADGDHSDTPGTNGCWVYLKNATASGANLIYIGTTLQGASAPANMGAGTTALDNADDASFRLFTLKRDEFVWMPWDFLQDIYVGASAASQSLEYMVFDR
tara:strand:+ start:107 stop:616 length:510 start_codon:yes stop_codon:yes gene_type:complete